MVFSKYDIDPNIDQGGSFLDNFSIHINIPQNNYYQLAKLHIEKDRLGFSKEIEDFVTKINDHNSQIKGLDELIDKCIENSFKKQISPIHRDN